MRFLSTLSLRRATLIFSCYYNTRIISIHALLAESDLVGDVWACRWPDISIHALLAESDEFRKLLYPSSTNFYPRSPCGERLVVGDVMGKGLAISIHALLAESDESQPPCGHPTTNFYPRSPCGERQAASNHYSCC